MADRKEYLKNWRTEHKEHIKKYNAERYERDKDDMLAQQKQYRLDNKDKINALRQEIIPCDVCGSRVSRHHLAKHKTTKKCMSNVCK